MLVVLLLAACSSRPPVPANLTHASTPLIASEIFPDRTQHKHYAAAHPEDSFIVRVLTPVSDQGLGPGLHVTSRTFAHGDDPSSDEPIEARFLSLARSADGSIQLVSSAEGGRTTHFDPPLTFMPASLAPGAQFEHTTTAKVLGENGREQTSGRATRQVTYSGDAPTVGAADTQTNNAPAHAGPFRVISARLDMDLFPARVVTTTTYWVNAAGIVREQHSTTVTVLGLPYQTRRHDVILAESRDADSFVAPAVEAGP